MDYIEIVELYNRCGLVGIKLCSSDIQVDATCAIELYGVDPAIISLLVIKPHIWMEILVVAPGMISLCSIDQLPDWIIFQVLSEKSELLSWFDYRLATLSTRYWPWILQIFPHLIDDPRVPYDTLEVSGWRVIVGSNERFHSRCDWNKFTGNDWLALFRSKCALLCRDRWMALDPLIRADYLLQLPVLALAINKIIQG